MRKEKRVYRHEVILFNENVGKEPFSIRMLSDFWIVRSIFDVFKLF